MTPCDTSGGLGDRELAARSGSPRRVPPVRVGILIDGNENFGVLSVLRTLFETVDRRFVTPVGIYLGRGPAWDVLAGLSEETYELRTGNLTPLSGPRGSKYDLRNAAAKAWTFFRAVVSASGVLRRYRIDVVHVHVYPVHLVAGLACRLTNTPCLWHWHGPFAQRHALAALAQIGFGHLATCILCISRFVADSLPAAGRRKCCVVYNGVEVAKIQQSQKTGALRRRLGLTADQPLIAVFGNILPRKGHEYFIRAAAEVSASWPEARFALVGREPERVRRRLGLGQQLRNLAEELRVTEKVVFVGFLEESSLYMADCDIICMPTIPIGRDTGEGFGLVLTEAMAAGVPAIATSCGAPPEIVEDGISGMLVPPRDSQALAGAMRWLLSDSVRREEMGRAAQRQVAERFDVSRVARDLEALYVKYGRSARANRLVPAPGELSSGRAG